MATDDPLQPAGPSLPMAAQCQIAEVCEKSLTAPDWLLSTSKQAMTACENGARCVPITTLPLLAHTLSTTIAELIGMSVSRSHTKRGPAPKIRRKLERVSQLPRAHQRIVSEVFDSLLAQAR